MESFKKEIVFKNLKYMNLLKNSQLYRAFQSHQQYELLVLH